MSAAEKLSGVLLYKYERELRRELPIKQAKRRFFALQRSIYYNGYSRTMPLTYSDKKTLRGFPRIRGVPRIFYSLS